MNIKKTGYSLFIVLLLVFNLISVITHKNQNQRIQKLISEYKLKCEDENTIISVFKNAIQFQGVSLCITDNSIISKFKTQTYVPLLLIKEEVCGTCMDNLLLQLEDMRLDSMKIVLDMSIAILTDGRNMQKQRIIPVFNKKKIPVFLIDYRSCNIPKVKKIPDMSFVLIDKNMKIISFCEYPIRYPSIFKIALNEFNMNYEDIIVSSTAIQVNGKRN